MSDAMADRRAAPRYPLILLAELTELSSGVTLGARTSDVSLTGCFIDSLNPFPKGSLLRVRLKYENETFEASSTVMYASAGLGMGLRFEDPLPAEQLAILVRWFKTVSQPA